MRVRSKHCRSEWSAIGTTKSKRSIFVSLCRKSNAKNILNIVWSSCVVGSRKIHTNLERIERCIISWIYGYNQWWITRVRVRSISGRVHVCLHASQSCVNRTCSVQIVGMMASPKTNNLGQDRGFALARNENVAGGCLINHRDQTRTLMTDHERTLTKVHQVWYASRPRINES